ncbi:MAG TPA: chemotaxis protein CheC [Gemmatimonadaceae bacterium]|nr:chemotaxis protein CheC [Gemmatimonadaceae bacterium]
MDDIRKLKALQLDALREVANIGAGHAATALSQMTGQTIMISVPQINIAPLEEIPNQVGAEEEPVAAVLMKILGDLTGLALLVFTQPTALRVAGLMMKKENVQELDQIGQSALCEAGNILSAAYLNALSEFMGMILLPSPPSLAIDLSDAVMSATFLEVAQGSDFVFCVETEFQLKELNESLRGFFLLLPDLGSLTAILRAIRVG